MSDRGKQGTAIKPSDPQNPNPQRRAPSVSRDLITSVSSSDAKRLNSVSFPPKDLDDAAQKARLKRIQSQAKNLSPMNPSKYAPLLPKAAPAMAGKKTLLLDVDETLVHSCYKQPPKFDLHLECVQNGNICNIYVAYRPKLFDFLHAIKDLFELVIFTASVEIYCNPLMNHIDPKGEVVPLRLFRDHCSTVNGSYVKDLSLLGRPLEKMAIIDNSPVAYLFQPRNAIPIPSWFDDPNDDELMKLVPMLRHLAVAKDVYEVLDLYNSLLTPSTGR